MSTLKTVNIQHPSSASVNAGTDTSGNFLINSGYGSAATAYGCRAWVNFNGTGTVAIRASGNVTSITDNGVGDYTVNITNAMPDSNYSVVATSEYSNTRGDGGGNHNVFLSAYAASTTTVNIQTIAGAGTTYYDCQTVSVSVFR